MRDHQQDMAIERCVAPIDRLTRLVVGGEIKRLSQVLREKEEPLKVVSAIVPGGWGLLVATSERVMWVDKGLVSFRADTIEYNRITSVIMHTGLVGGTIQFNMYGHDRIYSFVRPKSDVFLFGNLVLDIVKRAGRQGEREESGDAAEQSSGGDEAAPTPAVGTQTAEGDQD